MFPNPPQRANFRPYRYPVSFARQNRFGNGRMLTRMHDLMSRMISQHEEWLRYCLLLAPQLTYLGTARTRLNNVDSNTLSRYTLTGRFSAPPHLQSSNIYDILDSGANGSFVTSSDQSDLTNITATDAGTTIIAAKLNSTPSHAKGKLQLSPALTSTAQHDFLLDDLRTGTLISLRQLRGDDCIALFTKYGVKIIIIIQSHYHRSTK